MQQRGDPGLGAHVACQHHALQHLRRAFALQAGAAPLAAACVLVAQCARALHAQHLGDAFEQRRVHRLVRGGAQLQAHAGIGAAKQRAAGKGEGGHQALQRLARQVYLGQRQPGLGPHAPGQFGLEHLDGRMLELGLQRLRAARRCGQCVHARQALAGAAGAAQHFVAPVHGHEHLAAAQAFARLHGRQHGAPAAGEVGQVAGRQAQAVHVFAGQLRHGLAGVGPQAFHRAAAAQAVPLVAQAAGDQRKGVACVGGLGHGARLGQHKAGAAVGGGKAAVGVQACAALGLALGAGPLLRGGFQLCPAQAGDVQVAPARAFAVLVPDGLGAVVGEQAGQVGPRGQQGLHAPRHFGDDAPVRPGLTGRRHCGAHAADAAFTVGHGAFFFAPGGGGQQQVGIACGGRGGIGVLQHYELGAL